MKIKKIVALAMLVLSIAAFAYADGDSGIGNNQCNPTTGQNCPPPDCKLDNSCPDGGGSGARAASPGNPGKPTASDEFLEFLKKFIFGG